MAPDEQDQSSAFSEITALLSGLQTQMRELTRSFDRIARLLREHRAEGVAEQERSDSPERDNQSRTWLHGQPRYVRCCLWRFYHRTKDAPVFRFWDFKEFVSSREGRVRPQTWQSVSRHLRALGWLAVTGHGPGCRWNWLRTDLTEADFALDSSPLRGGKLT